MALPVLVKNFRGRGSIPSISRGYATDCRPTVFHSISKRLNATHTNLSSTEFKSENDARYPGSKKNTECEVILMISMFKSNFMFETVFQKAQL